MKNNFLMIQFLGPLFQKMRGTNPQRGLSVISTLIAIAILGLLAAMTSKLLVQQSSVSAASDLDYERDFMRRYIREGLNCCETLKPWMTSLKNARPLDPVATPPVPFTNCNSRINEEASPTILRHVNDKRKNSVHPLVDDGKLIAQVINFDDDDNAYSFGRWKFAIRCNEDSGRMFLTINSWRIGLDSRTGKDLSLAQSYEEASASPSGAVENSNDYFDIDSHRLCAKVFLDPHICP